MSVNDNTLRKIRALLTQAEDPAATKPESEAFMAKATELLTKYGIDRAMLEADDPAARKVGDRVITVPAPYAKPKVLLLHSIAQVLGVQTVLRNAQKAGTQELHLFGIESDLEQVEMLWTSLLIQCLRFQEYDFDRDPYAWRHAKRWRWDYVDGFRDTVARRLQEQRDRAKRQAEAERKDGPSVELVLVDRAALVKQRVAEVYPKTEANRSTRRVGTGYGYGKSAGNRADLGGTRVGAGSGRSALPA